MAKCVEYWHNSLNQQVKKELDTKDAYVYSYDRRGNPVACVHEKNRNHTEVGAVHVNDASDRMVKGVSIDLTHNVYCSGAYVNTIRIASA